jgi:hypothetical protein
VLDQGLGDGREWIVGPDGDQRGGHEIVMSYASMGANAILNLLKR